MTARSPGEGGAASAAVLGLAVAMSLLAVALVAVGHVVVERRRAAAGADLAALAGAVELQHGRDACPVAAATARRNGVELTACRVDGDHVRVSTRTSPEVLGRVLAVTGEAHAGPVAGGGS